MNNILNKNTELMLLICIISIAFAVYYFLLTIEQFNGNYIPHSKRRHIKKDTENNLLTYDNYIELEKKIRNQNEEKGLSIPIAEVSDLNWRIHRWSIWDYLPDINKKYYCKVQQYNGEQTCVPLSNKEYCSVENLYKKPIECLKSIKNNS